MKVGILLFLLHLANPVDYGSRLAGFKLAANLISDNYNLFAYLLFLLLTIFSFSTGELQQLLWPLNVNVVLNPRWLFLKM